VDGESLHLPDDLAGPFAVVLLFRGAWCRFCNAQLRAFQRTHEKLRELDVPVVALSVDDEETTRGLVAKIGRLVPEDVAGLIKYVRERAAT
jgi:peroxiredoxin